MKRFIYILFIVMCFYKINAQESISCETQKKNAIKDGHKGKYKYKGGIGHGTAKAMKLDFYFKNYLFTKFDIEYFQIGDRVGLPVKDSCYWATMDSLFLRKFGEDFIKAQYKKVNHFFWNLTEQEKSKILPKNKIFAIHELEKQVNFKGDADAIKQYFIKTYDIPIFIFNNWSNVLVIDIDGIVKDFRFNVIESEVEYKEVIISKSQKLKDLEFINKQGKWEPGYIYGVKVKSECFL